MRELLLGTFAVDDLDLVEVLCLLVVRLTPQLLLFPFPFVKVLIGMAVNLLLRRFGSITFRTDMS